MKNAVTVTIYTLMLGCAVYVSTAQTLDRGELRVTVSDAKGQIIPGAKSALSQKGTIIEVSETDANGTATFKSIVPGLYDLSVEKAGFAKQEKNNVAVDMRDVSALAIILEAGEVTAKVEVSGVPDNPNTVDAGSSPPVGNLQRKTLERLPLATKRVDESIPLIPGVIRSSTGEISINGAAEQQSSFLVNGLTVGDPNSGNFRLNLPVDAVDSVQVLAHPYSTEFGQFTGGITNIETRRGGDKFHFEINDFFPDFRFINGKIVGVRDDSPHLNINGPLIKDKLFFSQSLGYSISKDPVRGLTFPNNETKNEGQSYFTQLDFLKSSRHTQSFTLGYFPERLSFVGLDFFRPRSVTQNYKQKDMVATIRDNLAFKNGGLLQTSFSFKKFRANVWGQGSNDHNLRPTGEDGNYFASQARQSSRAELLGTYERPLVTRTAGVHNIKTGFNFIRVANKTKYAARPVNIFRADGTLAERTTFESSPKFSITNRTFAGFIQDRWAIRPNLSLEFGLRFEDQRIAREINLAPRLGFAWSPFSGDKTVVRGGIGYFYDKVPLNIRAFGSFPARTITRYSANGVIIIDQNRYENLLLITPTGAPLDFQTDRTNTGFVPENLTWNIQVDQTVNSRLSVRANYSHSRTTNLYIVEPRSDSFGRNAIVLGPSGRMSYDALELTARFVVTKKQPVYVSYVRSRSVGDLNELNSYFGDFASPIIRPNQYSNLGTSVPNRLLAWGSIALPRKIEISPILEWRTGFPFSILDQVQNYVGLRNAGNHRFPNFFSLDAELSKEFSLTKKYGFRISVRGFNLTDHFNPRNVRNNLRDPQFGAFLNSYRRFFTGGFDIIF